ncbi:MAG: fibronectin type III domain-containing protein [Bacteroidales bacterium]|nr:fibronectin type III domain-containing protein [Bacteroidales bacterium]
MKKLVRMLLLATVLLLPFFAQSQFVDYSCSFNDDSDSAGWIFVNGSETNKWCIGTDSVNVGGRALFISSTDSSTNSYNTGNQSIVYAYRSFELMEGSYYLSYNWKAYGESNYDYMRVFLAPNSATLTAGILPDGSTSTYNYSGVPSGWIPLDGTARMNMANSWQTFATEFSISTADTYKLVFMWCNDGSAGSNPPAAVDNILFIQPTCATPASPYVLNLMPYSFDFFWSDYSDGNATSWVVELDSATQVYGQGTILNVSDTSISFSNLTPNTDYTVHVYALCGSDTSMILTYMVHTPCVLLTTLPYYQDFESTLSGSSTSSYFVDCWVRNNDATTYYGYPYVYNSSTYSHNGGAKGLYWYNSTSGPSYGSYQCVVLPGIDTDVAPASHLQLTFWSKVTSSGYRAVFEVGVMNNPLDISSFVPVTTVNVNSTDWQRFVIPLANYTGQGNFIAVMARSTTGSWYAALDEFLVERIPACSPVNHVEVNTTGTTGCLLSWDVMTNTLSDPASYAVQVQSTSTGTIQFQTTVSEPRCLVTGLNPGDSYKAKVRVICSNDSISAWDSVIFTTHNMPCLVTDPNTTDTIVFNTGTSQVSGVPVYNSWGNTICQSIYTAEELNAMGIYAGMIAGLDYTFTTNSSYAKVFSIYVTSANRTTYSSSSDMVTVRTQDLVYGPASHPLNTSGTVHYEFTQPFMWDGSSSLIITTMMNQPNGASHSSSGFYGYSTSGSYTRTIYRYQDGTQYTPSNSTSGNGGTSTYRPTITIYTLGCSQFDTCAAPTVILNRLTVDTAAISWIPGNNETSWNVLYKAADDATWTTAVSGLTTNQYTFTTLLPMTSYQVRVVANCGSADTYAEVVFTTPCVSITTLPFYENFENFVAPSNSQDITECWHRGTNYSYNYPYVSTSYAHSGAKSMYFVNPGSSYYDYLALPPFATSVDSLQISFAAYKTSASYSIQVGVMTDPEDFGTFTPVATVSPASTSTWELFEVPLNDYYGNGNYIALGYSGSSSYMYIDDIEVSVIPDCPRPRNITFSNITTTTAHVDWVDTNANYFEIEYGPAGFAHGSGTLVTSSLPSVTLYGLRHSSRYEVYVRGLCSSFDTSNWSFVSAFTTECGIIDSLPYTQNFDGWGVGTGARPACWTCGGYSSYPYIMNVTDASNQIIGQTFYLYSYSSNRVYAMLPTLDSVSYPSNVVQTVFKAWTNNTTSTYYSHDVIVGLCSTTDISSFIPFDTITLTDVPTLYEVAFDTFTGSAQYITFVSTATGSATYNYVYLDSVAVEVIPECQRPNNLVTTNVLSNGVTLSWNSRSSSLAWQVEYVYHGFAIGSGTRITTTSNPLVITGLQPSTSYDIYVRSICGVGDTSEWSRTPHNFSTMQNPATIPYFFDFETSTEWDNWQVNSNSPINWYRGSAVGNGSLNNTHPGTNTMYISADSGSTCSTHINEVVNAVAYRDIDFGTIDSSFLLSFRASAGGCRVGTSVYDGLAVFLADPNTPLQPASNSPLVSPWGNVNDLTLLVAVYVQPGWNTYSVLIDSITGVHRLVFYWFNQNTTTIGTFFGNPAAVDDISLQYVECPRPVGYRLRNLNMASATLAWHGRDDVDYRVTLRHRGAVVSSDLVHTNSIHLTELIPGTTYTAYVRRLCGSEDSSQVTSYTFTTKICNDGHFDTIGNLANANTSYDIPVNNYYRYSYTQQLVQSSELSGAGEINGISFYYSGASAMTAKTACTIYMGHTTLSSFSGPNDFVAPEDMQIVYTGSLNCSQGWNHFTLNMPFSYNGIDNLVIAVDDNSSGLNTTSHTFSVVPSSDIMSLCFYSDTYNPDATSSAGLTNFIGSKNSYAYRALMSFSVCPPNNCSTPVLRDPIVRSRNTTLRWRNTGSSYRVGYRLANSSSWISDNIATTDTFYTINSLYVNTDYVYHVRQYCDTNGVSNWVEGEFNSSDVPCLIPMDLRVQSVTNNRVKLVWSPEENNIGYRVHLFNTYFDQTISAYLASATFSNLTSNTRYYVSVQANCQDIDDPSQWSDTISFVTDYCPNVTDLTYSNLQGNSVVLDWVEGGRADQWEIQWGQTGFVDGTGVYVITDHHPYTLTGLTGETMYDIYVRGICGEGYYSEQWSNRITLTTPYSSINSMTDDVRVKLFPNPTSSDVTISLPITNSAVSIEIIDMAGRVKLTQTLPQGTEKALLATSQLTQGAYYVRITGGDINTVKKLVVR